MRGALRGEDGGSSGFSCAARLVCHPSSPLSMKMPVSGMEAAVSIISRVGFSVQSVGIASLIAYPGMMGL